MKQIRYHDYGGPEAMKLEEVPKPIPKDDEILVRVHAMGVNPVDWKLRSGAARARVQLTLPNTPGGDISGVVEEVGSNVKGFSKGQQVFALIGLTGAYSEYVAIKAEMAAPKPTRMSHVEAASVPLAALTAWQALYDTAGMKAGQKVLVHAAAGGVGSFGVQIVKAAGSEAVGTCSAANVEFVRGLGAAKVIDYTKDSFAPYANSFDIVLDTMGGETAIKSIELLKSGGVLAGVSPPPEAAVAAATAGGKRAQALRVMPNGAQLAKIGALIDAGQIRTTIAATFPIADCGKAHDMSMTGRTRGKIVLLGV